MIKEVFKIFFVGSLALLFLALPSCEEQAPRLRSPQRKLIDSLYTKQVELLKPELDSICEESRQARIDFAVDSIMTLRLAERKRRLGY